MVRSLSPDVFIALSIVQSLSKSVEDSFCMVIEEGNCALRHKLGLWIIRALLHDPADVRRV